MTVTYTSSVSTSSVINNFLGLLVRWRGSIYKLVWRDLLVFLGIYVLLAIVYRLLINDEAKKFFEAIALYCGSNASLIPLSFVLGFYVSIVMKRWWDQYSTIPWPDAIAILVSTSIHGFDDRARAMRRTILRYVCLCQVIVFTMISPRVKRRFPTYEQIIEAGFLLENEKSIIATLDLAFPLYPKHWMPIVWAASIVMRARRENKIRDDYAVKTIIDELNKFRGYCGFLLYYDWVSVPLVYTQVVTLAVFFFFLCNILGQQWTEAPKAEGGFNVVKWFPILTLLQFFFYMGWLKVAESLINPFGEDDDDFELNWIIDRNITVSYFIVDGMHQEHPELVKDQYWDQVFPNELPYNVQGMRTNPPEASTAHMEPPKKRRGSLISTPSGIRLPEFYNLFLGRPSASGSYTDSFTIPEAPSRITFSAGSTISQQSEPQSSVPSSRSTIDFNELMEQRRRERRDRMRHRFLDMKTTQLRYAPSGAPYKITVLHPPSEEVIPEEEKETSATNTTKSNISEA
ncbi:bestrophin-4 [Drosophila serrata]|uniref:bestrophin-4 n=1 Tax=Drosophila serrata TaxID=7274 RepID=UPI000A1CF83F|nr:bestrophin-4 [Drosophila serrata]